MTNATTVTVLDIKGREINFDAAAALMDREICEEMHDAYKPGFDDPQAFIEEYARRHEAQFGETFAPYVGGAW